MIEVEKANPQQAGASPVLVANLTERRPAGRSPFQVRSIFSMTGPFTTRGRLWAREGRVRRDLPHPTSVAGEGRGGGVWIPEWADFAEDGIGRGRGHSDGARPPPRPSPAADGG